MLGVAREILTAEPDNVVGLFGLRDQQRAPIQAYDIVRLRSQDLAGDAEHMLTVSERLIRAQVEFTADLLELALRIFVLPLIQECQSLLRRGFRANVQYQVVLNAVSPLGGVGGA